MTEQENRQHNMYVQSELEKANSVAGDKVESAEDVLREYVFDIGYGEEDCLIVKAEAALEAMHRHAANQVEKAVREKDEEIRMIERHSLEYAASANKAIWHLHSQLTAANQTIAELKEQIHTLREKLPTNPISRD